MSGGAIFGIVCFVLFILLLIAGPVSATSSADWPQMEKGKIEPRSISVLTFAPDGTLFLGDSLGGAVFAVRTSGEEAAADATPPQLADVEGKIGARLGIDAGDVLIHDMAVHPVSQKIYLAVSEGRADWDSIWKLPNHVADGIHVLADCETIAVADASRA